MAFERRAVRKRVVLPGGSAVFIPCLERVPFRVAAEQYQDRIMYFRNGIDADRQVHVRDVPSKSDPAQTIQVERADRLNIKTMAEQAQERLYYLKNLDPPPVTPEGANNPAHERVHYVRYFQDNDPNSDVWVDVELIDQQKIVCAAEQYQEWMIYVRHDQLGDEVIDPTVNYGPITVGFCDPSLEVAPGEASGIDPPYRFDPFQNIIQFNEEGAGTPFDAMWATPNPSYVDPASGYTGGWHLFNYINPSTPAANYYNPLGGSIYPGEVRSGNNLGDIDFRFVEQFFEPRTYDIPGLEPGTGDIKGYTRSEWDVGWTLTPGIPPNYHPNWYEQLQAYAVGLWPPVYPSHIDFSAYGFGGILSPSYTIFWNKRAAHILTPGPDNPQPIVAVRLTAIGPVTTDNPLGRY